MSATATVNDSIDDAEAHLDRCDRQAQRFEILTAFLGCRHCHPQFRALVCLLFPVCKLLTLLLGAKHCLASQDPRVSIHVHGWSCPVIILLPFPTSKPSEVNQVSTSVLPVWENRSVFGASSGSVTHRFVHSGRSALPCEGH